MRSNPDVPSFIGYVETTVDALLLIYAARQGIIPRFTRRLNDSERKSMIKSGAVFVFCVQESQIKRWTDGLLWSQSRILGNFLVYRETDERTTSRGHKSDQGTLKTGGLIKKTITIIVQDSGPEPAHLHLISYHTSDDIQSGKLKRPSTRADIMNLYMPPHIFRLTSFRVPPKAEIGPDGKSRFIEVEDSGYSNAGLQGKISDLKRKPGLQSLVGVFAAVLNDIVVVVHNHYANEEALDMLAQKAGLFVQILVGELERGSDPRYINSVIERLGLTEEMNWVLGVLNKLQISFISQKDIARIEAKLIQALEMLQISSQ